MACLAAHLTHKNSPTAVSLGSLGSSFTIIGALRVFCVYICTDNSNESTARGESVLFYWMRTGFQIPVLDNKSQTATVVSFKEQLLQQVYPVRFSCAITLQYNHLAHIRGICFQVLWLLLLMFVTGSRAGEAGSKSAWKSNFSWS